MRVERLPPEIIEQYVDGGVSSPVIVYGGLEGNSVIACFGLLWSDGRCVLWFDVFTDVSAHKMAIVRWTERMKRQARQLGEKEIFVFRDDRFTTSERLLGILGFELCGCEAASGKEIFSCPV